MNDNLKTEFIKFKNNTNKLINNKCQNNLTNLYNSDSMSYVDSLIVNMSDGYNKNLNKIPHTYTDKRFIHTFITNNDINIKNMLEPKSDIIKTNIKLSDNIKKKLNKSVISIKSEPISELITNIPFVSKKLNDVDSSYNCSQKCKEIDDKYPYPYHSECKYNELCSMVRCTNKNGEGSKILDNKCKFDRKSN